MLHAGPLRRQEEVKTGLAEVYADIPSQLEVARIIQSHMMKKGDIRHIALNRLDLANARIILDLGCGTGYFSEGLKERVHPHAEILGIDVHPGYTDYFLQACALTGLRGKFDGGGISLLREIEKRSCDLVLSSYSLYFFPEYIPAIAGVLKPGGYLVAITHAVPHMIELTTYIKKILEEEGISYDHELPYDSLIRNFSDENGPELLSPWFRFVKRYICKSTLVFRKGEVPSLLKYLRYKEAFFLPDGSGDRDRLVGIITKRIGEEMKKSGQFSITKDDFIFVCSDPVHTIQN